jgi:alkanesulfonate monooxygenase SsuD/methylene tetrahydromethanopterin reductase-like flavin-dependent oxidoreductase (luciferase family)
VTDSIDLEALTPTDIHPWVAEGKRRVRFAVDLSPQPDDWSLLIDSVQRMEADGFDAYWCYDHPQSGAECWTTLSALAARTSRIRLASAMSCIYFRSPYMLARAAAGVDRLSGGRLLLGLGVGDVRAEFAEMGLPFPPAEVRHRGLLETVTIVKQLWSGQPFEFHGEQFSASCGEADFARVIQTPRVPILVGGGGEKHTLRTVARVADASNIGPYEVTGSAVTEADVLRKFAKLREYLDEVGRPYDSVLRSHFITLTIGETEAHVERKVAETIRKLQLAYPEYAESLAQSNRVGSFAGTPDQVIAYYQGLAELGFQYFLANVTVPDFETVELLGKYVLPAFA